MAALYSVRMEINRDSPDEALCSDISVPFTTLLWTYCGSGVPIAIAAPPKKKKQKICNEPRAAAPHAHAKNSAVPFFFVNADEN